MIDDRQSLHSIITRCSPFTFTIRQDPNAMSVTETRVDTEKKKALNLAISQIEKQLGKGSIMRMGADRPRVQDRRHLHRRHQPRRRHRHRRRPPRPDHRDLRPRVVRQDHALLAPRRQRAEVRRGGGLRRRRARPRHRVRQEARRRHREPAGLAARHRRAGPRDRRDPGPLRRGRSGGDRLGRGAGAEGRNRGRDGRLAHGAAGAAHEPGAAQAGRRDQPDPLRRWSSSTSCARRSA